jgi:hypothetical protein
LFHGIADKSAAAPVVTQSSPKDDDPAAFVIVRAEATSTPSLMVTMKPLAHIESLFFPIFF